MNIKSFAECLAIAGNAKKHLMLGNGFSISLFPKIFNYKTLSENIESERMKDLFKSIGTYDFEFVMRRLLETLEIIQHYDTDGIISGHISNDIDELKQTLIHVISKAHPPKPSEITDRQYNSCREFLMNFDGGKIYTFNYDLILYWVYMHFMDIPNQKLKCDDGFRYPYQDEYLPPEERDTSLHWEIGMEQGQSVYYIHGAMHIFSDGSDIEKLSYSSTGIPLAEQVQASIAKDKFPVFISEGSTSHKLARIKKNGYLSK